VVFFLDSHTFSTPNIQEMINVIRELNESVNNLQNPTIWYKDIKPNKNKTYIFQVYNADDTQIVKSNKNDWSNYFVFKGRFEEGFPNNRTVLLHIPVSSFNNAWRDCLDRPLAITNGQYFSFKFKRESKKRLMIERAVIGTYFENV